MGIFKKRLTVNEAINAAHTSENAVLIDCRAKEDYQKGHVAGTKNIPLDKITEDRILRRFPDKEKSFYIIGSYSYRSEKAVKAFKKMGYKNAIFGGYMEEHHGILTR
ncbi:MAG: rhodanese-like domain-containing protein [Lachnospiraceae bacterium]|jgi:rhodanese-related sulfurtransferase|nr:rhodanese-like domain-containing protein [Lachnospiraceae bacterium]